MSWEDKLRELEQMLDADVSTPMQSPVAAAIGNYAGLRSTATTAVVNLAFDHETLSQPAPLTPKSTATNFNADAVDPVHMTSSEHPDNAGALLTLAAPFRDTAAVIDTAAGSPPSPSLKQHPQITAAVGQIMADAITKAINRVDENKVEMEKLRKTADLQERLLLNVIAKARANGVDVIGTAAAVEASSADIERAREDMVSVLTQQGAMIIDVLQSPKPTARAATPTSASAFDIALPASPTTAQPQLSVRLGPSAKELLQAAGWNIGGDISSQLPSEQTMQFPFTEHAVPAIGWAHVGHPDRLCGEILHICAVARQLRKDVLVLKSIVEKVQREAKRQHDASEVTISQLRQELTKTTAAAAVTGNDRSRGGLAGALAASNSRNASPNVYATGASSLVQAIVSPNRLGKYTRVDRAAEGRPSRSQSTSDRHSSSSLRPFRNAFTSGSADAHSGTEPGRRDSSASKRINTASSRHASPAPGGRVGSASKQTMQQQDMLRPRSTASSAAKPTTGVRSVRLNRQPPAALTLMGGSTGQSHRNTNGSALPATVFNRGQSNTDGRSSVSSLQSSNSVVYGEGTRRPERLGTQPQVTVPVQVPSKETTLQRIRQYRDKSQASATVVLKRILSNRNVSVTSPKAQTSTSSASGSATVSRALFGLQTADQVRRR
jgi:hypothetical protein